MQHGTIFNSINYFKTNNYKKMDSIRLFCKCCMKLSFNTHTINLIRSDEHQKKFSKINWLSMNKSQVIEVMDKYFKNVRYYFLTKIPEHSTEMFTYNRCEFVLNDADIVIDAKWGNF